MKPKNISQLKSIGGCGNNSSARQITLRLLDIVKSFKGQVVLDRFSIDVERGEFLTLLGPSGCGKSTTLNLIAGFDKPDGGEVVLRGQRANDQPPQVRRLGMVFQSWALFPHLTAAENVAYGLRVAKVTRSEIEQRVLGALSLVKLESSAGKYPSQMSGGMQQRVALARALVTEPDLLLLDEPLSNLDATLRKEMQLEIRRIHEQLGITTILVTHSQEEALTMSNRVAVMQHGRIVQLGDPVDIYQNPKNSFVCQFLGEANVLKGAVANLRGNEINIRISEHTFCVPRRSMHDLIEGKSILLAIRPEVIVLHDPTTNPDGQHINGTIRDVIFKGNTVSSIIDCNGFDLVTTQLARANMPLRGRGDKVTATWDKSSAIALNA